MNSFMDDNFLLQTKTAQTLFHDYAAKMPVIDYHCHVNPAEIAEDRRFENITQVWLGGDHYKWRLIRANGTDERLITGSESSDREKFEEFAKALPKAVGNPIYHWTHLELQRYFNCNTPLTPETAEEIWNLCNKKLAEENMSVRGIIKQSDVKVIATTDDPSDDLRYHKQIAGDKSIDTKVVPSFRPDKALNIDKDGFVDYIKKLGDASGSAITSLDGLCSALAGRIDFFHEAGCRASDHGLDYVPYREDKANAADSIFKRALAGEAVSAEEADIFKTAVLLFLGKTYAKKGWIMQLHYSAMRNTNTRMFEKTGPDAGFDAIGTQNCGLAIAQLMNALEVEDQLPKVILYSLNPNDDAMLASVAGCFMHGGVVSKVQHGSAWWFNDTKVGMENQLESLASRGLLGGFIGMLTDSRSFLSYTRHEYFRRILCNFIGNLVENGEYPNDMKFLGKLVEDISYNNTANFFGF